MRLSLYTRLLLVGCFVITNVGSVHIQLGQSNGTGTNSDGTRYKLFYKGSNFTLTCEGSVPVRWEFSGPSRQDFESRTGVASVVDGNARFPYKSTLFVNSADVNDTGEYRCVSGEDEDNVYVYVHFNANSENCILLTPMPNTNIQVSVGEDAIIPCRATHPDVQVHLKNLLDGTTYNNSDYDPRVGLQVRNVTLNHQGIFECEATLGNCTNSQIQYHRVSVNVESAIQPPMITGKKQRTIAVGDSIQLNCTTTISGPEPYSLTWTFPNPSAKRRIDIKSVNTPQTSRESSRALYKEMHSILELHNAQKEDSGTYTCYIQGRYSSKSSYIDLSVTSHNQEFITFRIEEHMTRLTAEIGDQEVKWVVDYEAFPSPQLRWTTRNQQEIQEGKKFFLEKTESQIILRIKDIQYSDAGIYILTGIAGRASEDLILELTVLGEPTVKLLGLQDSYLHGEKYEIKCQAGGHPSPSIEWEFMRCLTYNNCNDPHALEVREELTRDFVSTIEMDTVASGYITCKACNDYGCVNESTPFFVVDVRNGFEVVARNTKPTRGETVTITCSASVYNFSSNITWTWKADGPSEEKPVTDNKRISIKKDHTQYSTVSKLTITNVTQEDTGTYNCRAECIGAVSKPSIYDHVTIEVTSPQSPGFNFSDPRKEDLNIVAGNLIRLSCVFHGNPPPNITWYKNGKLIQENKNETRIRFVEQYQVLAIQDVRENDEGVYTCIVSNYLATIRRNFDLRVKQERKTSNRMVAMIVAPVVIICLLLIAAVIYLSRRVVKEKRKVRSLTEQDVRAFLEGEKSTISPELPLDEQADLLPYNAEYEFPTERLRLGRQLGSGAYGRVVKGEAQGLVLGEGITTVAVKMLKPHAEISHLKALMTELKILIHIGKHLNVVNLLGACTTNIRNRELLVIVEYCRFGNIQSYLLRHRENFVDQRHPISGEIDFSIGFDNTEYIDEEENEAKLPFEDKRVTLSNNVSTVSYMKNDSIVQITDYTGGSSMSSDSNSEMRWNMKYKGDYRGIKTNPLCTKDLICWSYQVARGMEYLASRRIIHGDLAARNILLADQNVVKICDFGLARSLYKNLDYKKKSEDPLPIKWMSVESIRDRVFSTQSDVWSFGIVLWEFFSLGRVPYPGLDLDEMFLQKILGGYRMEKPQFSTENLYNMMLNCWKAKPEDRPIFSELVQLIGEVLDENVKNLYLELNSPYVIMNNKFYETQLHYMNFPQESAEKKASPFNGYIKMKGTTEARKNLELDDAIENNSGYLMMKPSSSPRQTHSRSMFL